MPHSPGPWTLNYPYITCRPYDAIVCLAAPEYEPNPEEMANARLIAAAPALLAACDQLLAILEDFPGFYTDEHARRIWTERRNAILAKMPS